MVKKVLIGVLVFAILASAGLFLWARAVLTPDNARSALAAQLSAYLGQPVVIGGIGAAIYPRVTVNLRDVEMGQPPRVRVQTLQVGADFRALLSRRIEHATLRLTGARIVLPLPDFAVAPATPAPGKASGSAPVEIVSIDEIVLGDVEIVSGGRTLRGDVEAVPQGKGVSLRRITLRADDTTIDIAGQITDLSGPTGELVVKAGKLDFDRLLAFVSGFASASGLTASTTPPQAGAPAASSAMNLMVSLDADSATMGDLSFQKLSGRAHLTPDSITLEPVSFGLFGGTYQGAVVLTPGSTTSFKLNAAVSGIDMAAATKFAGRPDTMTGRLSGKIDLAGRGLDAPAILKTARGTARVDITDGTIKRLGLVRAVVLATSGRPDAPLQSTDLASDEPFARLSAVLTVADGSARTQNLVFESKDLLLSATGAVRLDGTAISLAGQVQLSDALSRQAGRDLVRYTQEQGRVTLPVTIAGSADNPQVRVDVASLARRAITNRANQETQKAIQGGLGRLFGK